MCYVIYFRFCSFICNFIKLYLMLHIFKFMFVFCGVEFLNCTFTAVI